MHVKCLVNTEGMHVILKCRSYIILLLNLSDYHAF